MGDEEPSPVPSFIQVGQYPTVSSTWPQKGRHILATYDSDNIILYQAYNDAIANYAVENQSFLNCPEFSTTRMTWLKPNFLWMMYRSGWATKHNQKRILAVTVTREGFEEILRNSKSTSNKAGITTAPSTGEKRIATVRRQWDPDHDPKGQKEYRRAIQLGIKNKILEKWLSEWIVRIDDVTGFVAEQRKCLGGKNERLDLLQVPYEKVYVLRDESLISHIELDSYPEGK